jgi:putative ABC transport system substrate-binding protein
MAPELGGKRVELLKETLPEAQRIAVLWNPGISAVTSEWQAVQKAASRLEVALDSHPVRSADQLSSALASIARKRPDALLIILDARLDSYRNVIVEFAAKHRLPTMMGRSEFAFAGGTMSYAPSIPELFRRAATYVDKILKGAKPADLPVELPMRIELVVNLKTAKALGITIPQSILVRTDRVIE